MTKKAEEYHFYKGLGICVRCHKEQAEPNKVMCWECNEKDLENYRRKREQNRTEQNKKDLARYEILKQNGICTYCKHEKAMPGKYKCKKCLAKLKRRRDANRKDLTRSERPDYGFCYICGKNKLKEGFRVCADCYDTRMESIKKIMYLSYNEEWKRDNKLVFKKGLAKGNA